MRVAEFFSGIGLMRLGLERSGWQVVWANDIDPAKKAMYESHFGEKNSHVVLNDIHNIRASDLPPISLATASFPCTDLSLAGGRQGLTGPQSSAFWGFVRVMDDLADRRPPLLLIENVPDFITSRRGADFEAALKSLCALGYVVDPFIIDAQSFLPQSRERLFVACSLSSAPHAPAHLQPSEVRPAMLVDFVLRHPDIHWRIRALPPLPTRTQRLEDLVEDPPETSEMWWSQARANRLLAQMSLRHRAEAERMMSLPRWSFGTVFRRTRHGIAMAELRVDGVAGCLRTPKGGSARQILLKAGFGRYAVRLLSGRECARLMGADDFVLDVPLNQALFGFGDAVCVPVVEWIARNYLTPLAQEAARVA